MLARLPQHLSDLLTAADLIERTGLAKACQRDRAGAHCVQGAISVVATGDIACSSSEPRYRAATNHFLAYLRAHNAPEIDKQARGAAFWNNADERTAKEVIDALRDAAMWVDVTPA